MDASLLADGDDAQCVVQFAFVPRTPPTSVSAAATGAPSAAASSSPPSCTDSFSIGRSTVLPATPPPPLPLPSLAISRRLPLAIQVRKGRILAVATALVALLSACIGVLFRGVVLTTGDSRVHDFKALQSKADELNFLFGSGASLVAKLFEVGAAFVLPVVVLVLLTEDAMLNDSFYWILAWLLGQAGCIALLTNAFSTTYVATEEPKVVRWRMADTDLFRLPPAASPIVTSYNGSSNTPRRASADTMLRTAMLPAYARPTRGVCATSSFQNVDKSIAAKFGFHTSEWLQHVASTGVDLRGSLNMTVRDWLLPPENATPPPTRLPFNMTIAANLAIHALWLLVDRADVPLFSASTVDPLETYVDKAIATREQGDVHGFLTATAQLLNESLSPMVPLGFLFAPSDAQIQFSSLELDEHLSFDAITLTLPFQPRTMQRRLVATQFGTLRDDAAFDPRAHGDLLDGDGNAVFQVFPQGECGTRGCWLTRPTASTESETAWSVRPEVVAYSRCTQTFDAIGAGGVGFVRCVDGDIADHAMVVGAVGSALHADAVVEFDGDSFTPTTRVRRANVTNLRRTLTATLGFFSWHVHDLAERFSAECTPYNASDDASPSRCRGLALPLDDGKFAVVHSDHLPTMDELNPIARGRNAPLVALVTNLPDGSFLPLRNVKHGVSTVANGNSNGDGNASRRSVDPALPDWPCSRELEAVADSIELNHWYIDHSLQDAYTAALFHVFQFGANYSAVQRVVQRPQPLEPQLTTTLDLPGNVEVYVFRARIPSLSAAVSLMAGTLLLVSIGVVVGTGRRRECAIRDVADVHRVARVHLVEQFFPKVFIKCTLLDAPRGRPLAPFRIVAMTLHHAAHDGDVYVTLPAASDPPDETRNTVDDTLSLERGFLPLQTPWPEPSPYY